MNNYQPGKGLLSVHGRFDDIDNHQAPDFTNSYVYPPTAYLKTSCILDAVRDNLRNQFTETSSLGILQEALNVGTFPESLPSHILDAVKTGIKSTDIMSQVIDPHGQGGTIFNNKFGGMFSEDYVVGAGASGLLRADHFTGVIKEFTPRISSVGGLNANAIFGDKASDPAFMNAFNKQFTMAKLNNARSF